MDNKVLVLECNLKRSAYEGGYIPTKSGKRKLDDKWRFFLTEIDSDELNNSVKELYSLDNPFCPKARKDLETNGTISTLNLSTNFKLPTMISGHEDLIENVVGGDDVPCKIKIILKENAIYPVALKVIKNGEMSNPFEDM